MNIQLCALTIEGDFVHQLVRDVASARLFGKTMVDEGEWKTWDAFCLLQRASAGRRLVASHGRALEEDDNG